MGFYISARTFFQPVFSGRQASNGRKVSMNRRQSAATALENLKKEAKRWLKALRANDLEARRRLERAYPAAPAELGLRDVQRALALEHGLLGWSALKQRIEAQEFDGKRREELIDLFLENACADPILANGPAAHAGRSRAALRILSRHPEIARENLHTAAVCGDLEAVKRILEKRPEAATERSGPRRRRGPDHRDDPWTPILHLCYGRLPTAAAANNALAIARLLLDHGADPNDHFKVGSPQNRYTTLCGAVGGGEDSAPPHPQREALVRLLLERGAEPYDIQLFYNTHFHGDILWILEMIYEAAVRAGRRVDWDDPNWSMINMGGYGFGARYFLWIAVTQNKPQLAEWLLSHGANPNAEAPQSKLPPRALHEEAMRRGFTDIAMLLERYGAVPSAPVALEGEESFKAACLRFDREEILASLAEHPEYLNSPIAMFAAAEHDRAEAVEFLLDQGTSVEVKDEHNQRPLHIAASHDSLRTAALLIERGAEIDPVETNWGATPLSFASYGRKTKMIELLGRVSHDVWELTSAGQVERLQALIRAEPALVRTRSEYHTPLMWLPDDENQAVEIVKLFLESGADPTIRDKDGLTAAERAERRGLYAAAELLRSKVK
jgi:ankyrin repeat protein